MHAFIYMYLRIPQGFGEIGICKAMGCFRFISSEFRERKSDIQGQLTLFFQHTFRVALPLVLLIHRNPRLLT